MAEQTSLDRPGPDLAPCCAPIADGAMSAAEAEVLAATFATLADPVRLRLLSLVANAPDGICGCDLTGVLDRSQPTISHHLKSLTEAGLLEREKRGRWVWYSLRPNALTDLAGVFSSA
ncbi:MAG: winged helix-turn-helix transcriptional regulator [Acidimicrobiales bacterium]|nr:winged helix-turn-helix transcriptional regulator [Acidimicrobiales bacterium]